MGEDHESDMLFVIGPRQTIPKYMRAFESLGIQNKTIAGSRRNMKMRSMQQ